MPDIEADARAAVGHLFHRNHLIPASQENPMTQPQPQRVVDSLRAITAELASNPLIARLAEHGLGKMLTGPEADSIATIIAGIEQPRRQAAAQQQQQHDDGTQAG